MAESTELIPISQDRSPNRNSFRDRLRSLRARRLIGGVLVTALLAGGGGGIVYGYKEYQKTIIDEATPERNQGDIERQVGNIVESFANNFNNRAKTPKKDRRLRIDTDPAFPGATLLHMDEPPARVGVIDPPSEHEPRRWLEGRYASSVTGTLQTKDQAEGGIRLKGASSPEGIQGITLTMGLRPAPGQGTEDRNLYRIWIERDPTQAGEAWRISEHLPADESPNDQVFLYKTRPEIKMEGDANLLDAETWKDIVTTALYVEEMMGGETVSNNTEAVMPLPESRRQRDDLVSYIMP